MTMVTERELEIVETKLRHAEYKNRINEWTIRGLIEADRRITLNVSGDILATKDFQHAVRILGESVASRLLYESNLAFRDFAIKYEMETHIHVLENLANTHRLKFKSWDKKKSTFIETPPMYYDSCDPRTPRV